MIRFVRHFWEDRSGGPAAEFSLVLPVLLLFIFGTIDIGRFLYAWNQAEKATQIGARFAVATEAIPSGMKSYSYATVPGGYGLLQGAIVSQNEFGGIHCTSTSPCTCKGTNSAPCPFSLTHTSGAFTALVNRMRSFKPDIVAADVFVDYDWSGLGYAGDPNGPDIAPMVTVGLQNMQFRPITFFMFKGTIALPSFRTTLSMEDGDGSASN